MVVLADVARAASRASALDLGRCADVLAHALNAHPTMDTTMASVVVSCLRTVCPADASPPGLEARTAVRVVLARDLDGADVATCLGWLARMQGGAAELARSASCAQLLLCLHRCWGGPTAPLDFLRAVFAAGLADAAEFAEGRGLRAAHTELQCAGIVRDAEGGACYADMALVLARGSAPGLAAPSRPRGWTAAVRARARAGKLPARRGDRRAARGGAVAQHFQFSVCLAVKIRPRAAPCNARSASPLLRSPQALCGSDALHHAEGFACSLHSAQALPAGAHCLRAPHPRNFCGGAGYIGVERHTTNKPCCWRQLSDVLLVVVLKAILADQRVQRRSVFLLERGAPPPLQAVCPGANFRAAYHERRGGRLLLNTGAVRAQL